MAATAPSISPRGLSAGLWALSGVLAVAGAFLLAGAVRARPVEAPLPSLNLTKAAMTAPAARDASPQVYDALAGAAVFGSSSPPRAAAPEAADASVKATIVGTIVRGAVSRAVVDLGSAGQRLVKVGDSLEGGRVAEITASGVILERDGRQIALPVRSPGRQQPGPAAAPVAAAAPPAAPPRANGLSPAQPNEQKYSAGGVDTGDIDLKDFDGFYGDLKQGFLEVQAKTAHDAGGKPVGLDFDGVPEGKLLWRMGLRAGDIVTEVNTIPVTDMNSLLNAFDKVAAQVRGGNESFIVIDLVRNQKPDAVILTIW